MATVENLTRKGRGRPKGSPNKVGKEAKEVIASAAEGLGGLQRLIDWAKADPQNEKAFWASIYPKLLPLTVAGDAANPLRASLEVAFVERAD